MVDLVWLLAAEGLDVVGTHDYKNRKAPGSFFPVGVMNHHTAGAKTGDAPSLPVVIHGREGLPGPLCNVLIARSGRCHIITNGRANDSGTGSSSVLERVRRDEAPLGDARHVGNINGNPYYYDIEVENTGRDGDPYPAEQLDALVAINAALCRHFGWTPNRCIHHREWTSRKIDMSWRGDLRGLVLTWLRVPPMTPARQPFPVIDGGDDVKATLIEISTDPTGYGWGDADLPGCTLPLAPNVVPNDPQADDSYQPKSPDAAYTRVVDGRFRTEIERAEPNFLYAVVVSAT